MRYINLRLTYLLTYLLRLLRSSVTAGARTYDPWIASPTPYRLSTPSAEVEQNKCVGVAIATFDVWKRTMDHINEFG